MDASAVRMLSVLDIHVAKGNVLLLFVPTIPHVAYAERTSFEFMELYHATSDIWDASIKHTHAVLGTEEDKPAELLHLLVPVTHVVCAKQTSPKTMTPYHALNKIKGA